MNYEFLKKCVSNAPVSPMAAHWWEAMLDLIPQDLMLSAAMQEQIEELHKEVLNDYDKSIRKSMGM